MSSRNPCLIEIVRFYENLVMCRLCNVIKSSIIVIKSMSYFQIDIASFKMQNRKWDYNVFMILRILPH